MATLKTPLGVLGSQTAPTVVSLTAGSADSKTFANYVPMYFADLDDLSGVGMTNGIDPIRHSVAGVIYDTGILPPSPDSGDMTATPSGARATTTFDLDDAGNGGVRERRALGLEKFAVSKLRQSATAHALNLGGDLGPCAVELGRITRGLGNTLADLGDGREEP